MKTMLPSERRSAVRLRNHELHNVVLGHSDQPGVALPAVFGLRFTPLVEQELATVVLNEPVPYKSGPRCLFTANVDHVVRLQQDPVFRAAYDRAWAITADGMPVYAYARARGVALTKRVTGADLFPELMRGLRPGEHRCFFVCNSVETGIQLAAWLSERGHASSDIGFVVPPFGFERDEVFSRKLARQISEHGTTHLFVGVGAPKSEKWIHQHRAQLGDCYVFPVGAALEFFVGQKRRAPRWMQRYGMEWLWRLAQEPRRLAQRYLVGSWGFLAAIRADLYTVAEDPSPSIT
jgi:N-acetylglucosaminyldiphosphoundecaprenol N-acetyl-beta-D-mannosaminyltransferase